MDKSDWGKAVGHTLEQLMRARPHCSKRRKVKAHSEKHKARADWDEDGKAVRASAANGWTASGINEKATGGRPKLWVWAGDC
jgi:hypothetical protein